MAPGEDIFQGHIDIRPLGTASPELIYSFLSLYPVLCLGWNQMCYSFSVPRDAYSLTLLDISKKFGEVYFGFCRLNHPHCTLPNLLF